MGDVKQVSTAEPLPAGFLNCPGFRGVALSRSDTVTDRRCTMGKTTVTDVGHDTMHSRWTAQETPAFASTVAPASCATATR